MRIGRLAAGLEVAVLTSRRTYRPGANAGPPDDPFQSYDISSSRSHGSCGYFGVSHVNLC